jgi:hypothetical protein
VFIVALILAPAVFYGISGASITLRILAVGGIGLAAYQYGHRAWSVLFTAAFIALMPVIFIVGWALTQRGANAELVKNVACLIGLAAICYALPRLSEIERKRQGR